MDGELRKLFSQLKSNSKTTSQRKAYNRLVQMFATDFDNILSLIRRDIKDFNFKLLEDTPEYYILSVISPSRNNPFKLKVIKTGNPLQDFNDAVSKLNIKAGNFDDDLKAAAKNKLATKKQLDARKDKGYIYIITDIKYDSEEGKAFRHVYDTVEAQIMDGQWENNPKMAAYTYFFNLVNYNGKCAFELNPYAFHNASRYVTNNNPYNGRSPYAVMKWWLDQYKRFVGLAIKEGYGFNGKHSLKELSLDNKDKSNYGYINSESEYEILKGLEICKNLLDKYKSDADLNKPMNVKYPF